MTSAVASVHSHCPRGGPVRTLATLTVIALLVLTCAGIAAAVDSRPGIFTHELSLTAEQTTGMRCVTTIDAWRPRFVVATVVCRAVKVEVG